VEIDLVEDSLTLEEDHTRSEGVHLSDLVRGVSLRTGHLDAQWADSEINPNVVAVGLAWEEYIARRIQRQGSYKGFEFHPGEIEAEGVYMTCDGVSIPDDPRVSWRVHEIKCTWKSGKHTPTDDEMWMYLCQLKGYCWGWETIYGALHVYFLNGDYKRDKPGPSPIYHTWNITFTVEELESNWKMLMNYRKYMERTV
jgi:hypothetical protein